ncbi:MAG: lipopolysaccharide biosynthesis protein RfbH [Nanoarchaeota archaeon]
MDASEKLKNEIFERVKQYYELVHKERKFVPGETKLNYAGRIFDENEMIAATDAVLDFMLTVGKKDLEFGQEFSKLFNVRSTTLTNSGSSANLLAVSALKSPMLKEEDRLRPGDEVITPATTFPTTLNPIIQNNLIPVFLDAEIGTYNMGLKDLKKALSRKTKAIVIPHTLGNPNDMEVIMEFVEKNDLYLIEDCCDALDSRYDGKLCGTFGDLATFSFFPAHHITQGEAGAVITNNSLFQRIVNSLRDWGRDCWCEPGKSNTCKKRFDWKLGDLPHGYDHKYIFSNIGYNLKPLDIQPAIGLQQLKKLPKFTEARRKNFKILYKELSKYDEFIMPRSVKKADPSWFAFPITVNTDKFTRDEITNFLESYMIETRMLFCGNVTKQPAYKDVKYRVVDTLNNTNRIMYDTFFVGVYPGIDKQRMDFMLGKFEEFIKKHH